MSLSYKLFKLKRKILKNYQTEDLTIGTKIETYHGISTIVEIGQCVKFVIKTGQEKLKDIESIEKTYICDTNYCFDDEPDQFLEEDIVRIIKKEVK